MVYILRRINNVEYDYEILFILQIIWFDNKKVRRLKSIIMKIKLFGCIPIGTRLLRNFVLLNMGTKYWFISF